MKKQIYKIGDRVKILHAWIDVDLIGKVLPIVRIDGDKVWLKGSQSWWTKKEDLKLISPKKVTKPSKKEKPRISDPYSHITVTKQQNGYSVNTYKDGDEIHFVFNTKARLLKWIGEHI